MKNKLLNAILAKPSQRTQLEASIAGLFTLIITSLASTIYLIWFTDVALIIKTFSGIGELAIISILWSNLAMAYQQYAFLMQTLNMHDEFKKETEIKEEDIK